MRLGKDFLQNILSHASRGIEVRELSEERVWLVMKAKHPQMSDVAYLSEQTVKTFWHPKLQSEKMSYLAVQVNLLGEAWPLEIWSRLEMKRDECDRILFECRKNGTQQVDVMISLLNAASRKVGEAELKLKFVAQAALTGYK